MGKNLQNGDLVMRDEKRAFYEIPGKSAFILMEGLSSFSISKSATEHNTKYVDERSSRTFVTGYEESISYTFDRYNGNEVQDDIVSITDDEKIGKEATRRIIQVDMKTLSEDGTQATGRMRSYSVVPDSDGDDANVMTYSGTLKCNGEWEKVTVTSYDDWQTITVKNMSAYPSLTSLNVYSDTGSTPVAMTPEFSPTTTTYSIPATESINIRAVPEISTYMVAAVYNGKTYSASESSHATINTSSGGSIAVIVTGGTTQKTKTYTINIASE